MDEGNETHVAGAASEKNGEGMASLVALVSDIAERQKSLEENRSSPKANRDRRGSSGNRKCFVCKKIGHIAKECWYNNQRKSRDDQRHEQMHVMNAKDTDIIRTAQTV